MKLTTRLGMLLAMCDSTAAELVKEAINEIEQTEQLRAKVAELEKDAELFNLYYDEEYVGTFYQGSFSTEEKAIEYRDYLLNEMRCLDMKIEEFTIKKEAIDQAIANEKG